MGKMGKRWRNLKDASPEVREQARHEGLALFQQVKRKRLGAIRLARQETQVAVAERMRVAQTSVSRLECQTDCRLSTLRNYVAGLGGKLEMRAVFPDEVLSLDGLLERDAS